jgi:hypothetical protein
MNILGECGKRNEEIPFNSRTHWSLENSQTESRLKNIPSVGVLPNGTPDDGIIYP